MRFYTSRAGRSKLSSSTAFTGNQNIAKSLDGYVLKSEAFKLDGTRFLDLKVPNPLSRATNNNSKMPFYKIFSDGNGSFSNVLPSN